MYLNGYENRYAPVNTAKDAHGFHEILDSLAVVARIKVWVDNVFRYGYIDQD